MRQKTMQRYCICLYIDLKHLLTDIIQGFTLIAIIRSVRIVYLKIDLLYLP